MSSWEWAGWIVSFLGWWVTVSITLAVLIGWSHHRLEARRESYSREWRESQALRLANDREGTG